MSTRAHVIIRKAGQEDQFVYHHCDGYPEGVGEELDKFFKNTHISNVEEAANALAEWDSEYVYENRRIHGDEEWLYLVNLDECTITCYEVWHNGYCNASMDIMDKDHWYYTHNMCENEVSLADDLRTKLKAGIVAFKYNKVNGEVRKAIGTLNPDCSADLAQYVAITDTYQRTGVVSYWDMEKNGWRSVREANIVEIF